MQRCIALIRWWNSIGGSGDASGNAAIVQPLVGDLQGGSLLASVVIPQSLAYGGSSFAAYAGSEKLAQRVQGIGQSHSLVILECCF